MYFNICCLSWFWGPQVILVEEATDYIGGLVKSGLWDPFDFFMGLTWVHLGFYSLK